MKAPSKLHVLQAGIAEVSHAAEPALVSLKDIVSGEVYPRMALLTLLSAQPAASSGCTEPKDIQVVLKHVRRGFKMKLPLADCVITRAAPSRQPELAGPSSAGTAHAPGLATMQVQHSQRTSGDAADAAAAANDAAGAAAPADDNNAAMAADCGGSAGGMPTPLQEQPANGAGAHGGTGLGAGAGGGSRDSDRAEREGRCAKPGGASIGAASAGVACNNPVWDKFAGAANAAAQPADAAPPDPNAAAAGEGANGSISGALGSDILSILRDAPRSDLGLGASAGNNTGAALGKAAHSGQGDQPVADDFAEEDADCEHGAAAAAGGGDAAGGAPHPGACAICGGMRSYALSTKPLCHWHFRCDDNLYKALLAKHGTGCVPGSEARYAFLRTLATRACFKKREAERSGRAPGMSLLRPFEGWAAENGIAVPCCRAAAAAAAEPNTRGCKRTRRQRADSADHDLAAAEVSDGGGSDAEDAPAGQQQQADYVCTSCEGHSPRRGSCNTCKSMHSWLLTQLGHHGVHEQRSTHATAIMRSVGAAVWRSNEFEQRFLRRAADTRALWEFIMARVHGDVKAQLKGAGCHLEAEE